MTPEQVAKLEPGLYRLTWHHGGGTSLASVGLCHDGTPWYAPCNWGSDPKAHEGLPLVASCKWEQVERAEPILLAKDAAKIPTDHKVMVCTWDWNPMTEVFGKPAMGQVIDHLRKLAGLIPPNTTGPLDDATVQHGRDLGLIKEKPASGTSSRNSKMVVLEAKPGQGWIEYPIVHEEVEKTHIGQETDIRYAGEAVIDSEFLTPSRTLTCTACRKEFVPPTLDYYKYHDRCLKCRGK